MDFIIKMSRYTWTQIMKWEADAAKRRVPSNIEGLVLRHLVPNNRFWIRRSTQFERNGEKTLLNILTSKRLGVLLYLTACVYQMWRVPIWGYIDLTEHHNYNYDNIVYDKLSTRMSPYHSGVGFP